MNKEYSIEVWTQGEVATDTKNAVPVFGKANARVQLTSIEVSTLGDNFKELVGKLSAILEEPEQEMPGGFGIDEVEISLGVNAKGGFTLIGTAEVGAQAGIKVKLKRK